MIITTKVIFGVFLGQKFDVFFATTITGAKTILTGAKTMAEIIDGDEVQAEDCCGCAPVKCDHFAEGVCYCTKGNFRGKCIFCLFDGQDWDEQWDTLVEVLIGISLKALELGQEYAKTHEEVYQLKNKNKSVAALHKVFTKGYDSVK